MKVIVLLIVVFKKVDLTEAAIASRKPSYTSRYFTILPMDISQDLTEEKGRIGTIFYLFACISNLVSQLFPSFHRASKSLIWNQQSFVNMMV